MSVLQFGFHPMKWFKTVTLPSLDHSLHLPHAELSALHCRYLWDWLGPCMSLLSRSSEILLCLCLHPLREHWQFWTLLHGFIGSQTAMGGYFDYWKGRRTLPWEAHREGWSVHCASWLSDNFSWSSSFFFFMGSSLISCLFYRPVTLIQLPTDVLFTLLGYIIWIYLCNSWKQSKKNNDRWSLPWAFPGSF